MEGSGGHDHEVVEITTMPGGATAAATSRWNPTKEQITMLENLYRQGIRTPTAEQIQEITGRLQAYGHIEGKNVFYWFQNHKARQRQKQKQENSFAYLHRYLHHQPVPPALFPPPAAAAQYPCPNVVCGPYYVPQPDIGFYTHQYPKVLLPGNGIKKNYSYNGCTGGSFNLNSQSNINVGFTKGNMEDHYFINGRTQLSNHHHHDQETLELFPMHPTGILKARTDHQNPNPTISETAAASPISSICMSNVAEKCSGTDQLYFDFFSGN